MVVPEPLVSLVRSFLTDSALGDLWKLGEKCGCWELLKIELPGMCYRGAQVVKEEKSATRNPVVPIGLN